MVGVNPAGHVFINDSSRQVKVIQFDFTDQPIVPEESQTSLRIFHHTHAADSPAVQPVTGTGQSVFVLLDDLPIILFDDCF